MEAFIDDMLVKSKCPKAHIVDLEKTLITLKQHHMRLNPSKYQFRMFAKQVLGYLICRKGISTNLAKVQIILDMMELTLVKKVHRLIGRIAALSRFLSMSVHRCLPFFKTKNPRTSSGWLNLSKYSESSRSISQSYQH